MSDNVGVRTGRGQSELERRRLVQLTIEGFRGFAAPVTLNLDASAVLFCGPNGSGKTSVFDSLQWLLTGSVPRLDYFRLRRNEEYLTNRYWQSTSARVEAIIRVSGGLVRVTRRGTSLESILEISVGSREFRGVEAESWLARSLLGEEQPLAEILHTTGLLQQDDMRQILRTKPDDRYRQLLRLLGLQVIDRYEKFTAGEKKRAKEAATEARDRIDQLRAALQREEEALETALAQVRAVSETDDDQAVLESVAGRADTLVFDQSSFAVDNRRLLTDALLQIADACEGASARLSSLPSALVPMNDDAEEIAAAASDARERVSMARAALTTSEEAREALRTARDALSQLSAAALPFLRDEEGTTACPVCGNRIDPKAVAVELQGRAEGSHQLMDVDGVVREARAALKRAETEYEEAKRSERLLKERLERNQRAVHEVLAAISRVIGIQQPRQLAWPALRHTGDVASRIMSGISYDWLNDADWHKARRASLQELELLKSHTRSLLSAIEEISAQNTAVRVAAERQAAAPRHRATIEQLRHQLAEAELADEISRRAETAATALAARATDGATRIFRDRFDALAPIMNDIYARLDPHPAFTRLNLDVETYRAKGTASASVLDEEYGVRVNPMLVFSSAQANIVVLSAFLALGWATAERGMPFLLLDDPLQALDDVNVLGFSDLSRRLRQQKQLVVATHESRFAALLERKLHGRAPGEDLIVHEFVGYSRGGPTVETRTLAPRLGANRRVFAAA